MTAMPEKDVQPFPGRGGTKVWLVAVLCAALGAGAAAGWRKSRKTPAARETRHEFNVMRTTGRFILASSAADGRNPADLCGRAEAEVRDIEARMSPFLKGSDVWRLNHAAPDEWVAVHPLTWRVVMEALRFHRLTGGVFDPTIGPLKQLYFPDNHPRASAPSEEERAEAAARVGARHLRYEREGMRLAWAKPGMRLDLSALAKGFAVDRAMEVFQAAGVRDVLVEIGGELRLAGTVPAAGLSRREAGVGAGDARRPWRLEVLDPRRPDLPEAERQYLVRTDGSVATSGDYEQYFEDGGRRYSHLIDPRAGRPADGAAAATVVFPGPCMLADAMATTLCVLGPKAGAAWMLERADDLLSDGAEAWVYWVEDGEVKRERLVIPGDGLTRMMPEADAALLPPPPARVPANALAAENEAAEESRWLRSVLGR